MKQLWSRDIVGEKPSSAGSSGIFIPEKAGVAFYYQVIRKLYKLICTESSKVELVLESKFLPAAVDWETISQDNESYLMCGENICIHLDESRILSSVPKELMEQYRKQQGNPYHLTDDTFQFGEYLISHKGQWGYSCHKNGMHLWDFSGRAYLYTDIFRYENNLYFGTAGQGGYFYILNIEEGKPILALKTGGTSTFFCKDSHVFLTVGGKKSQLVEVDLRSGRVCDAVDLPEKVANKSPLTVYGDKAYAVTFKFHRNGVIEKAILNCIGL